MSVEQILLGILTIWLIAITYLYYRLQSHYSKLTADVSKKDLISSLNQLISVSVENSESLKNLSEKLKSESVKV